MSEPIDVADSIPEAFEALDVVSGIEQYRLRNNDLNVLLLPRTAAPVVTFMITYHVGSRNEPTGLTGATHFLEHLMFKGTHRFNKEDNTSVFNVLQAVGARVNATTWFDRTNYYEMLPREHLGLAVEIEADRMRGARISEADLESERTVILNEFDQGQNNPIRKLYLTTWSMAYIAHPYHHPTIGWRSDIEDVSRQGLRHFYDTFYWPNNATVSIIGNFDREEALTLVERHFGAIPRAPQPFTPVRVREPEQVGLRRFQIRQHGELGALMLGFKTPPGLHKEVDALDVLSVILASGKRSRLYQRLTDQSLTTSIYASVSRLRDPGLFTMYAFLSPGVGHEQVEAEIIDELQRIATDGVAEEELARAKGYVKAQEAFGRDGSFAIAAQLNEAIAAGDWKLYADYMSRIAQVTSGDILQAARTYLLEHRCTIGWFVPEQPAHRKA